MDTLLQDRLRNAFYKLAAMPASRTKTHAWIELLDARRTLHSNPAYALNRIAYALTLVA